MTLTRCPRAECAAVFEIPERELGRGLRCERCGAPFTARPESLWRRLHAREEALRVGDPARALPPSESDPRRLRRYLYHPLPEGEAQPQRASDFGHESSRDVDAPRAPAVDLVGVLDDVRSQWNVGAIFRTADAAGISGLRLCGITPIPPARGVLKTSLGAEEMVPWAYGASVVEVLRALRAEGRELVALELGEGAASIFEAPPPERGALVLGNEIVGVSAEARALVSRFVQIPMAGRKGSLNVAVAFGVAAFEWARAWRARFGAAD